MVLPFVRDLFADAEKLPAFPRVASHLKEGTGRIGVSGLTPTAKALLLVLLQKATGRPLIVVVADNPATEELVPRAASLLRNDRRAPIPSRSSPSLSAMCCPFRISRHTPKFRKSARPRSGRLPPARHPSWCRRLPRPPCACVPPSTTPTWRAPCAAARRFDMDALIAHLNTVGYMLGGCGRNARRVRAPRRHSRCLLSRSRSPRAHRILRRRSRVDPQIRSRHPALFEPGGRSATTSADRNPGQRRGAGRDSRPPFRKAHHRSRRGHRTSGSLRRRDGISRLGVLRAGCRRGSHHLRPARPTPQSWSTSPTASARNSITSGRASTKPTNAVASATWCGRRIFIFRPTSGGKSSPPSPAPTSSIWTSSAPNAPLRLPSSRNLLPASTAQFQPCWKK